MNKITSYGFLHGVFWAGWHRWVMWFVCIGATFLLSAFRASTDAEFTIASLLSFPVLVVAWLGGRRNGLYMAFLAAGIWAWGDFVVDRQFSAAWIPWANAASQLTTYSLLAFLAAQVRLQFDREHEHATSDALTGLRNRRALLDAGASEAERAKRYARPLSVAFLDLDDFKQLNDARGHDAGDEALRATARALRGALRSNDVIARLGGDEFAILLPEIGYEEAVEAGRKISVAVNDALRSFPPVKTSIGIAWFGEIDRTFDVMLKAADELMYEAKESGKNSVRSRRFAVPNEPGAVN